MSRINLTLRSTGSVIRSTVVFLLIKIGYPIKKTDGIGAITSFIQ